MTSHSESIPKLVPTAEDSTQVRSLKKKLNACTKTIHTAAETGKLAVESKDHLNSFKVRFERAETAWERFQELWDNLDDLYVKAKQEDLFPTEDDAMVYDEVVKDFEFASVCMLDVKKWEKLDPPDATLNSSQFQRSHHLPKIKIPQFDGDLLKWCSFRDVFTSLVHDEASISNVEKFNYLRDALKGEPATLISKMSVTDEAYALAWAAVKKQYDNPRVLASFYIRKAMEFSPRQGRPSLETYQEYLTGVVNNIEAYKCLKIEDSTEFLLSHLSLRALDPETRREFELSHLSTEFPTTQNVFDYVRNRITALRLCSEKDVIQAHPSTFSRSSDTRGKMCPRRSSAKYSSVSFHTSRESPPSTRAQSLSPARSSERGVGRIPPKPALRVSGDCPFCKKTHALHQCLSFNDLPRQERSEFVQKWKGCMNCLKSGHWSKSCPSKYSCKFCGKRHHSLIHSNPVSPSQNSLLKEDSPSQSSRVSTSLHTQVLKTEGSVDQVLLGTALVPVRLRGGKTVVARALLDSCSHYTFITSHLARKLGGSIQPSNISVSGLGGVSLGKPLGSQEIVLMGREAQFNVDALVVKCISSVSPSARVPQDIMNVILHEDLADGTFGEPGTIDMLIGGDIFAEVINGAPTGTRYPKLRLLPTVFGNVVIGRTSVKTDCFHTTSSVHSEPDLERLVERFWKVEEPDSAPRIKPEDSFCETQFVKEHTRTENGRYMVKLPVNPEAPQVGDNKVLATRRFLSLERKLQSDRELGEQYKAFMKEYLELGHMSPATSSSTYIIPHHGIWQGAPEKRKLRVVFDASCPTRSPSDSRLFSLNDTLFSGPKLQPDIVDVFIQFRMFAIALTADLVKMYRQVLVHPSQRPMQHILWREDPSQPLLTFELNTLTYGVKPCAYLAIRTVHQLVIDEGQHFPLAASRILKSMYVDDFVSGTDTIEEARQLREELIGMFAKGGFALGKWSCNAPSIIPLEEKSDSPLALAEPDDLSVKILGMVWDPRKDTFSYSVTQPEDVTTKRKLLSTVARIFDPLGLLAPVIFSAKCLLQALWKAKLDWDDPIPKDELDRWRNLAVEWGHLSDIHVPRHITYPTGKRKLIGFCDASFSGSAAAVYCRSESHNGEVQIHLVKAKTKLSPTHYVSIARLELCGALLLARMISSLDIPGCDSSEAACFTDSMVVLSWLKTPTYELKTYEANRVNAILEKTCLSSWFHVRSEDNPADLASRGCGPKMLQRSHIWWSGPSWLTKTQDQWPVMSLTAPATWMSEVRNALTLATHKVNPMLSDWMSRFSSLRTLVRTVVRILRFIRRSESKGGPITSTEYEEALVKCIMTVQRSSFPSMFSTGEVPANYINLSLFLAQDGIVRVGGRLKEAPLEYSHKHPMFVPRDAHISRLIVDDVHEKSFHAGPTLTLSLIRNKFWIPGGLRFVKSRISRCVRCRLSKAKTLQPMMGSLPKERFGQFRAFTRTGVDFAGPFSIKATKLRRSPRTPASEEKAYVCIFVCLASKAVHIEAVSAMTTNAFLAALDRFCARRGAPQCIVSDNGSNFIGASRYLKDLFSFFFQHDSIITEFLSPKGIEWQFNPPRSPHFGGIWEAGVKSIKTLLASTIGPQGFTFEELSTILIRIEGLLNSRPLCPLSEDPDQLDFLTPGHFLIGCPLSFIPEISDQKTALDRWEVVKQQVSTVWERWKTEYLHHLQQRSKWHHDSQNPQIGDLVILNERRGVLGQWPVARICDVHLGSDGRVRVVSVRCPSGAVLKRSVCSLAPLFFPESNIENNLKA